MSSARSPEGRNQIFYTAEANEQYFGPNYRHHQPQDQRHWKEKANIRIGCNQICNNRGPSAVKGRNRIIGKLGWKDQQKGILVYIYYSG